MKKLLLILAVAASSAALNFDKAGAAAFTPGNLVVDRMGDGSAALTSAATPVFLDEFTFAGAPGISLAMPITTILSNRRLTDSGTTTSAGQISRSVDGQYIVVPGYDAAVGAAGVATSASASVNRVIGRVDSAGNIDTTTALSDSSYSGNAFRSVASINGTSFWTAGNATAAADGGTRYVSSLGGSTSIQIAANPNNNRVVSIQGGQLFASAMSGAFRGVNSVSSGIPTTIGQTSTLLPGFDPSVSATESAYGFVFADTKPAVGFLSTGFDTLWVADDRTTTVGGIQRWTFDGSTWTLNGSILLAASANSGAGARGLTGTYDSGSLTMSLFATSTESSANRIVGLTDVFDGSSTWLFGSPSTLATAPANEVFRGIAFTPVPEPTTLTLLASGGLALLFLLRHRRQRAL